MTGFMGFMITGYGVGMACMLYLTLREWHAGSVRVVLIKSRRQMSRPRQNWFGVVMLSMAITTVWCFLGTLLHFLSGDDSSFLQLSFIVALALSALLSQAPALRKADKIAVITMVIGGLGLLPLLM